MPLPHLAGLNLAIALHRVAAPCLAIASLYKAVPYQTLPLPDNTQQHTALPLPNGTVPYNAIAELNHALPSHCRTAPGNTVRYNALTSASSQTQIFHVRRCAIAESRAASRTRTGRARAAH